MNKVYAQFFGVMNFECVLAAKFFIDQYPQWIAVNDNYIGKVS